MEEDPLDSVLEKYFDNIGTEEQNYIIPLTSSSPFTREDLKSAIKTLLSGYVTQGEKVKRFEEKFADYLDVEHAIMVNSGSSANLLALKTLTDSNYSNNVEKGKVLTPAVTWSTTIFPIHQSGLTPKLVDIDLGSYTLDIQTLEENIDDATVGIMPVHLLGNPCNMDQITRLAERNDLFILEDCCEAHGAEWKSNKVGSIGDIGTFSFYFSHHMTTIEGGILVTDNDEIAQIAKSIRAHGWIKDRDDKEEIAQKYPELDSRFLFVTEGYNLRSTEINAALGLKQLDRISENIEKRREIARYWNKEIEQRFSKEVILNEQQENGLHSWFAYPIVLRDSKKKEVVETLEEEGIETRPIVAGNIAEQPCMESIKHEKTSLKNAEKVMEDGFYVGLHKDIEKPEALINALKKAFRK
ncbi:MAG: DegT/DnrJ/EryC1/StrS family aminotransferase [Candidatus Nanohaloarchaea archaeon]